MLIHVSIRFLQRFGLMSTSSFKELDLSWREELSRLHDDYFYGGRSDSIWREQALRTLPVLQEASNMLVCGEDLGMIPACVHPVMEELGVIGEHAKVVTLPMASLPSLSVDDPG